MIITEAPIGIKNITPPRFDRKTPSLLKVSAVIITYNEAHIIRKTLSQLYWCDEIIIVDSYSTDNTLVICREFGCRIYSKKFDGYGDQKRFGVARANNDWVLCIDADEVLTDKLVSEITSIPETTNYAGFSFPMNLVFLGKEFLYGKESNRHFIRLFDRKKGGFTEDKVHESIQLVGEIKKLRHTIRHYSYTSLSQYLDKSNRYSTYSAEIAFSKGKKKSLPVVILSLPFNFIKYYFLELNFLNGINGFYWSVFSTCHHLSKYVKLRGMYEHIKQQAIPISPSYNHLLKKREAPVSTGA